MDNSFNFSDFLKNLTEEQLAKLGARINEAVKSPSSSKPVSKITVNVAIDNSNKLSPAEFHDSLVKLNQGKPLPISLNELTDLQKIQIDIIRWINSSKENAALFAASPAKALRKSSIPVSELLLSKLESLENNYVACSFFAGDKIEKIILHANSVMQKDK